MQNELDETADGVPLQADGSIDIVALGVSIFGDSPLSMAVPATERETPGAPSAEFLIEDLACEAEAYRLMMQTATHVLATQTRLTRRQSTTIAALRDELARYTRGQVEDGRAA
jgi:hypothetical protein